MTSIRLPPQTISAVIANPSLLRSSAAFKLSAQDASFILSHGYSRGFKCVFILNASWTVIATIASILLIKHNDLSGEDGNHRPSEEKAQTTDDVMTTVKITANMA